MSELNKQAFPAAPNSWGDPVLGMTLRQHAAITLRVPMSGDPELDAMIIEARRLDMATAAMQGPGAASDNAEWALEAADALLAASEPKMVEPECKSCNGMVFQDGIGDTCKHCAGTGISSVSDPCICQYGKPQPDAEGWIEWKGGDCPVRRDAIVDVKIRDVHPVIRRKADCLDWLHEEHPQDIIAYRVVK